MLQQVGQEVVEIGLGDGFAEDGGHEAEVGFGVVGDLGFLDGVFLTGGVGEDEGGAFLAALEAGDDGGVLHFDDVEVEDGIDGAVGVEDVFDEAFGSAVPGSVELGADDFALAADLMADGAVGGEDELAGGGLGGATDLGGEEALEAGGEDRKSVV